MNYDVSAVGPPSGITESSLLAEGAAPLPLAFAENRG